MGTDNAAVMAASEEYLHIEKITNQMNTTHIANIQLLANKIPRAVATPLPPLKL